jgi:hypothetical protein
MKGIQILLIALMISSLLTAKEYNVAKTGNNNNQGTYVIISVDDFKL